MIEVYLNFNGKAREAANFYAEVFGAPEPRILHFSDIPARDQEEIPESMADLVIHANVKTFAGDIMLSDTMPDKPLRPGEANWILVSHTDLHRLRQVFEGLSSGGEVIVPLGPAFFSPLYGQLKDKFGFYWMIKSAEEISF